MDPVLEVPHPACSGSSYAPLLTVGKKWKV